MTHVKSHRKLQEPTRLMETIESQKVSKPPKKKLYLKTFVAQHTYENLNPYLSLR